MPSIPSSKPYRIGRSKTGLGLFATRKIKKGTKIIRYIGPLLDSRNKKHDAIDNKYLFEINNRWTIDGSTRKNIARYINHACKPNAESDVSARKRKVVIRSIKTIQPGEEINYDYGTDYFKIFLKPIGCKCDACEKKRAKKRAEERAEKKRLKIKTEKKAARAAEKSAGKAATKTSKPAKAVKAKTSGAKASKVKTSKAKTSKAKTSKAKASKAKASKANTTKAKSSAGAAKAKTLTAKTATTKAVSGKRPASPHARGGGRPTRTKAARTRPLKTIPAADAVSAQSPDLTAQG